VIIKDGYYIKARCIRDSWIAHSAPVVRETWDYLLREANHKERKYNGYTIKRGQLFRSYREIRNELYWMVGASRRTYSVDQMKHTMKLLSNNHMVTLANAPRGVVITICNYDHYQDPSNYESTSQSPSNPPANTPRVHQSSTAINKNVKELKNEKNLIKPPIVPQNKKDEIPEKIQEIFNLWNKYAVNGITKAQSLTESRKDKIRTRLKENSDIRYWKEVFSKLQKIPFYCGDNNRGWVVTLDYVIRNDTNHVKIAERSLIDTSQPPSEEPMDYAEQEYQKLKKKAQREYEQRNPDIRD
jgi:hypothetical protein